MIEMEEEIKKLQIQVHELRLKNRKWILLALMFMVGTSYFYNQVMVEDLHHRLDEIEEKTFTLNPYRFCPGFENQVAQMKAKIEEKSKPENGISNARLQKDKK